MNWFIDLFVGSSLAHSIMILALTIAIGIILGRIKIGGISLGITWILFTGIAFGHFGMGIDPKVLHFVKEFGLILFVYAIGLSVGPSFFSSFKKGGVTLNLLAVGIVLMGVLTAYIIHLVTGTSLVTMVGVLSGAVTNTPGLGAAQQTFTDVTGALGAEGETIAMGYAVAYPLGVLGIIMTLIAVRFLFRIKLSDEQAQLSQNKGKDDAAKRVTMQVTNPKLFGKTILEASHLIHGKQFVVSRICHADGKIEIPKSDTQLFENDRILVVTSNAEEHFLSGFVGKSLEMSLDDWKEMDNHLIIRRIVITKPEINGKRLSELKIRTVYGVNITRITRAGVDLVASPDLQFQIGDRVLVVGAENDINALSEKLGNQLLKLREPHLFPIFIGIALGVIFGSIPVLNIHSVPVKLGLAGGPLVIAILISYFGPKYKLVTYNTISANMMLREIGISLFLAAVGLGAGEGFVDSIVGGGYKWVAYGFIITVVPLFIALLIGRYVCKLNYFTLMGLIAGSMTDPPALAYSNGVASNSAPSVAYATVYPLTMFMRVLTAQMLILIAC